LVRKIYRSAVVQARYENLRTLLSSAKDPDIFRYVRALETSRTLPAMYSGDETYYTSHANVSDLIASQLDPVQASVWVPDNSTIWDSVSSNVNEALRMSPSNTATAFDDMSYPFLRFWHRKCPSSFLGCLRQGVTNGNSDWHEGKVVLIRKANKPRYDMVKGWRMIHQQKHSILHPHASERTL